MGTMFQIKRGDTRPILVATLSSTVNDVTTPIDLTGVLAVKFMFERDGVVIERTATISSPPTSGVITYQFTIADWDAFATGNYAIEIQIAYAVDDFLSVPTKGFGRLTVTGDLGD